MSPAGMSYVPIEEERRVFRECNQESFWYRYSPFSSSQTLKNQTIGLHFGSVLEPPPTSSSYSDDFSYTDRSLSMYEPAQFSSSFSESAPSGFEDLSPQVPALYMEDETPKRKPIMYEELRNKNRENFEVKMTQKAEVLLKPQQDRVPKTEEKHVWRYRE